MIEKAKLRWLALRCVAALGGFLLCASSYAGAGAAAIVMMTKPSEIEARKAHRKALSDFADRYHAEMLENSMRPASPEECQVAHPARGRPDLTISWQSRSNEPYHHRICYWKRNQPKY